MQTLDWVFVVVLAISMLVGAWRGLVFEVVSVLSWIAAFVLAQWLAPDVAQHLSMAGASEVVRYGVAFVLVFIATIFAGGLVAFLLKKLLAAVGLSPADRALGALFGAVRAVVVVLALTVVVGMTPIRTMPWWQDAMSTQWAAVALHGMKPLLPQDFGKYLP
jgi:membrane protein required for colicin V production